MFDYGGFKFESKQEVIEKSIRYWNPDKTRFWQKAGIEVQARAVGGVCPPAGRIRHALAGGDLRRKRG